jgi:hypothetical protein
MIYKDFDNNIEAADDIMRFINTHSNHLVIEEALKVFIMANKY